MMRSIETGPDPLDKNPFFMIFRLGVKIQHLGQKLEKETGLSLTQWTLLKRIMDHPAISVLELAASVGVQPSTLTQAIKRLDRKGLIFLGKDPSDSRRKILSLTRKGKTTIDETDLFMEGWITFLGFTPGEIWSIWDNLRKLP